MIVMHVSLYLKQVSICIRTFSTSLALSYEGSLETFKFCSTLFFSVHHHYHCCLERVHIAKGKQLFKGVTVLTQLYIVRYI